MGRGQVLDKPELAWPSRLWYDAEWGGLKSTKKKFCFFSSNRAKVALFLELSLYNVIKLGPVLSDGWPIWRGESLGDESDACIKSKLKVVGYVWVPVL